LAPAAPAPAEETAVQSGAAPEAAVSAAPVAGWAMPQVPWPMPSAMAARRGAAASDPGAQAAPDPGGDRAEGGGGAVEGELHVDGALLGRFVAEMLGREAGRPQAGMTGFDPLVSPAWPGALQG